MTAVSGAPATTPARYEDAALGFRNHWYPAMFSSDVRETEFKTLRILGEADVPCGKVLDSVELLNDPHLRERGMVVTVQHPVRGEFTMPGCPVKLEDSPVEVTSAPLLGEHNNEVFAKYLGFDTAELERLKQEGVI